jgi:hypothetical protein
MEYDCQYCNKTYKSYQSRCNHIRIYHKQKISSENKQEIVVKVTNQTKIYKCECCNKEFKHLQSRWRHHQKCKTLKDKDLNELKEKLIELEKYVFEIKKNQKNSKINNGLINNGTINNFIIPPGQENLGKILNEKEKLAILNSGNNAHVNLTNLLYQKSDYEKYRNIYITNLSNDIGYIYDKKEKKFIVKTKKSILQDYGMERFSDIQEFYEDLGDKVDKFQLDRLKKMVHDYFNDNSVKQKKNKELLISLYNNKLHVKQIYEIINEEVNEIEI